MWLTPGMMVVSVCVTIVATAYAGEVDPNTPRVPANERAAAMAMTNPIAKTPENIAKGKAIFEGKGSCHNCHGLSGKGDGRGSQFLIPSPRNFTNPAFHKNRTDGEMYWVIKNGSRGPNGTGNPTGMLPLTGNQITEEEAWYVILYERSFESK